LAERVKGRTVEAAGIVEARRSGWVGHRRVEPSVIMPTF
jgi:hypothetical protein